MLGNHTQFKEEDLRKLNCYSLKDNLVNINKQYSEILFNADFVNQNFFELLKKRYANRLQIFCTQSQQDRSANQEEEKVIASKNPRKSFLKMPKSPQNMETDYLIVPENYKAYMTPLAIHIRVIFIIQKYLLV